jgi:AraC-like DNA-binding protein/mannose-6-phosphate isomerase-like protein (cupin superfamily)
LEFDNNNVCKFNLSRSSDLICLNFIREKNEIQKDERVSEHYAVNLVINGIGVLKRNGEEYEIKMGDLFFLCEGDSFAVRSKDSLDYAYICFHGRRADEFAVRFGFNGENSIFSGHEALISFWKDSQQLADEENIDIVCESVLLHSIARLKSSKKERSDVISKVVTLTQKNFTDPALSISLIADELKYDPKYLSSVFKKKKGIPYTQYLREMRIKHAIFLMEQGVVSVKNVAILSGFSDALYFSKIFTASEGISPKAYIQKLTGEDGE